MDVLLVIDSVTNNVLRPNGGAYVEELEEARAAIAELIAARDEAETMPIHVALNWICDGNGEPGETWWPRRRRELEQQGYVCTGESSSGAEFFVRSGMTDRLAAALARCGGAS